VLTLITLPSIRGQRIGGGGDMCVRSGSRNGGCDMAPSPQRCSDALPNENRNENNKSDAWLKKTFERTKDKN